MGKIVKYCAACDESFAEKFGFCPNCGEEMTAFEMNPVNGANGGKAVEQPSVAAAVKDEDILEIPSASASPVAAPKGQTILARKAADTQTFNITDTKIPAAYRKTDGNGKSAEAKVEAAKSEELKAEEAKAEEPETIVEPETKTFAAAAGASAFANSYQPANNFHTNGAADDGGYRVTVIEEKNVGQRNLLLLGSLIFMTSLAFGGLIYNLFTHSLYVGAINEDNPLYVAVIDDAPMTVEEEQKKEKDEGGGGGGGGRDEKTPTSKGQLATQTEKPMIAPTKTLVQKDFELQYQASTQGTKKIKQTNEPYGDPNSKYGLSSDGMGSGGGQGSGFGNGQGSGRGTGQGSGIGSGSGDGNGDGNGDGRGNGNGVPKPPPPPQPKVAAVTEKYKIISKPRAEYTDAARQNQVTGTVTVKVTFLASGQIGSVTPVNGLPYGLTEKAIAAAKGIRFEPAKRDGVPYTMVATVQYNFNIY